MSWPQHIAEEIARQGPVVRITVIRAEGSTPRDIGAAMLVGAAGIVDTIGGGTLEFEAMAIARVILARGADAGTWRREWRDLALGPSLGQCCGGSVRLMFELFTQREQPALTTLAAGAGRRGTILRPLASGVPLQITGPDEQPLPAPIARALRGAGRHPRAMLIPGRKGDPDWFAEPLAVPATPLVLYGAGHVGRALIRVLEGLPFAVTWVDIDAARFPAAVPAGVVVRATSDPAEFAAEAPPDAVHIVMTYSHPLDLAICHGVLSLAEFGYLGLIGSATKRVRFLKRLRELGITEDRLARLVCPIGLPGIDGKQPAVIAVAIAAELLQLAGKAGGRELAFRHPVDLDADRPLGGD
jgi:xanthine dehydrogenase accessory factor